MLLVDDILFFPVKGLFWVFDEIQKAAEEELKNDASAITSQLQQLYVMLESGTITETQFDAREAELLDRLDALQE